MKKKVLSIYLILFAFFQCKAGDLDDFISLLSKLTTASAIEVSGNSISYEAGSQTAAYSTDFTMIKDQGNTFYEDKYHTLFIKPTYNIWIDHKDKMILVSKKAAEAKVDKKNSFVNPVTSLEFLKSQVKTCTKNKKDGGTQYILTYDPLLSDCSKVTVDFDNNNNLKRLEYTFDTDSYLSKTIITYNVVSTNIEHPQKMDESRFVTHTGTQWQAVKAYKNYKLQILEYEELF